MSRRGEKHGVFISYRRQDTGSQAGRIYDRLADRFGESNIFMDVDSVGLGLDLLRYWRMRSRPATCSLR
jgi:hypothetical protein